MMNKYKGPYAAALVPTIVWASEETRDGIEKKMRYAMERDGVKADRTVFFVGEIPQAYDDDLVVIIAFDKWAALVS